MCEISCRAGRRFLGGQEGAAEVAWCAWGRGWRWWALPVTAHGGKWVVEVVGRTAARQFMKVGIHKCMLHELFNQPGSSEAVYG